MALPDAGTTSTLRDVPLNECWKIGEPLPTDKQIHKHATVYLVQDKTGVPVEGLEAHAFELDDIPPKIRAHRLRRCIKRRKPHTKLQIKVQNTLVVVVSTPPAIGILASAQNETIDRPVVTGKAPKSNGKVAAKTPYEQELARTRQREKRKAKRLGNVQRHLDTANSEEKGTEMFTLDEETDFAAFLTLIWIVYDETGTMKEKIPTEHYNLVKEMGGDSLCESLEKYLKQTTTIELESPAEMESYLKAKRGETILLRQHLGSVPSAEKYHHDKLETLVREQIQYQKDSEEWRQIEFGPKAEAALEFRIVLHAKTALPRILASQKSRIRSIERKRSRALDKLASAELSEKRGRLVQNVAWYEAWEHTIFPVSHARTDLLRQLEAAKVALAVFDSEEYPGNPK